MQIAHAGHFPWDQGHDTFNPKGPSNQDNPPDQENATCGGDPVDLRSGNFFHSKQDFSIPGVGPKLAIVRAYHSQDRRNGIFGRGWHTNLTPKNIIVFDGDNIFAILCQENGKRKRFQLGQGDHFTPPPGTFQQLQGNSDGTTTLRATHGSSQTFDSSGRLIRIEDRNGNALGVAYDDIGFIRTATDASGRSLTFTKGPNGKVSQITDPLGRSFFYD